MAASLRHSCRLNKKLLIYAACPSNHILNQVQIKHLHTRNLTLHQTKQNKCQLKHKIACQNFLQAVGVRYASTDTTAASPVPEGYILDTPPVPFAEKAQEALSLPELTELGEPTLQSMGFASGGWFSLAPKYEAFLQYIHVSLDVPWWVSIVIVSLCARVLLTPAFLWQRKALVNHSNIFPEQQRLKMRVEEAKNRGNHYETQVYQQDYDLYCKDNPYSMYGMIFSPVIQGVTFLTVYRALSRLGEFPVEALKTGGCSWFLDLTLADPFYILPIMTSLSLWLMMELGTDSQRLSEKPLVMKCIFRALPVVSFIFISQFPVAMALHFFTNNLFSLVQSRILQRKAVIKFLNLPEMKQKTQQQSPQNSYLEIKGRLKAFQHRRQLEDRKSTADMTFKEAGEGPVPKTYSYDPTKKRINMM